MGTSAKLAHLAAQLGGLEAKMDERDRRYSELEKANQSAVSTAMIAAEKAVNAALAAAEKASAKTEEALKEYKVGANEWRDTVKDLISNLREADSVTTGGIGVAKWIVIQTIAIAGLAVSIFWKGV